MGRTFYFEVRLLMARVVIYHSLISMLILILHAVTCICSQYVKIRFAVNALVASLTDIKSPLQSQTGVRENVLTRSFKENRGFIDFQFQFYLTFSITLDISRVFELGS